MGFEPKPVFGCKGLSYGLDDLKFGCLTCAKCFFPKYPNHRWGPPTLLFSGYHHSLTGTNKAGGA